MRRLGLLLALVAAAAPAAERKPFVSTFTRLRVEGPFRVTVAVGGAPGARVTGDERALDAIEVRQDGDTLVVRPRAVSGDAMVATGRPAGPVAVTLATPSLAAAYVVGAGEVSVAGMRADRVDLSVAGGGSLSVSGVDAGQLMALSLGAGRLQLAGRAGTARLTVNGSGTVAADALAVDMLTARLDGPGEIAARARSTAGVQNTGLGRVSVAGPARCTVRATAGGEVTCAGGVAR